ncbi:MAG: acetyl-CoA C-acyltransferase [Bacteroidetes bacterium]|nr:acetyl-CoA C-acyltransferase [Bacteroidota bacterium]MBP6426008.1 acetyl-CoA C-acyltransferase [Bacteroidia bacterium]MBK8362404.1 acetyl-CoA C-acyltransferase [Bacteroidota bacterium]MBK9412886.1 acetyl-CoA C-acyltransferase [Bacteroidota bacterium]MBL0032381.1 acetyl-CoA C-acyltransferase [Bacteroidota bacterium]
MKEVYIISTARTPIGSFGGSLSALTATQLGAHAIKSALEKVKLDPKEIQEVYMGNVLSAGVGQAPVTQASIWSGIPDTTPGTTVNKVCASGMKAIMLGAESIMLGLNDCVVAGGMESMSNVPYYLDKARNGYKLGHGSITDGLVKDGLWDVYKDYHMGNAAELCATECKISREDQDAYALESYKRSRDAYAAGMFKDEISPVSVPVRGKDPIIVSEDEEYKNLRADKVAGLKPAFQKDGTVTAANASKLNDGAAAVILMSKEKADKLGLKPIAKIRGFADAQQAPEWFTTTPSKAMPKAAERAGLKLENVDYFEINEAFSVVSIANNQLMKLNPEKVNVFGGAVSLGHPLGASGARIVVTLLNVLKQKGGKIGAAGICNGGGGASAIIVELV